MIISIEGINGSGKSYMLDKMADIFNNQSDEIGPYRDQYSVSFHETKPTKDELLESNNFLSQDENDSLVRDLSLAELYLNTFAKVTEKIKSRKNLDFSFLNRFTLTNFIYTCSKYNNAEDLEKIKDKLYPIYSGLDSDYKDTIAIPDLIIYVDCNVDTAIARLRERNEKTGKLTSKWESDEKIMRNIKSHYDDFIGYISMEKDNSDTIFNRGNVFYKEMVIVAENFGTKEEFDVEIETICKSIIDLKKKNEKE